MWPSSVFRASVVWPAAPTLAAYRSCARYGLGRPILSLRDLTRQPCWCYATAAALLESQDSATVAGFGSLRIGEDLTLALSEQHLSSPTEIQSTAIPEILQGGDVLLASHTGSGKTLAYLLPLIKQLKDAEAKGAATRPKRPRALVLAPTRELTEQILSVAKGLSHFAKFRSTCINGGRTAAQQAKALDAPMDIVVGTPQRVMHHSQLGNLFYGDVEVIVLDEADTMFDRGFGPEVRAVLKPLRSKAHPTRCILVLATLSKPVRKLLEDEFPKLRYIETSSLHRAVPNAHHTFVPMSGTDNKLDRLAQMVQGDQTKLRRTMVFCNTLNSCRAAEHFLGERGLATVCHHGDVPFEERKVALSRFAEGGEDSAPPVLVCTDLAARGLDIPGKVDHVINFDFPLNPDDYLHRTGRTARAGASGRVTSLVQKRERLLATRIEQALQAKLPIDSLTNAPNGPARPNPAKAAQKAAQQAADRAARKGKRGASRFESPANKGGAPPSRTESPVL
ncbi:hypothetical protein WJX73_003999 [Symbiochloris irregularis]|uniref:Uncharacterized protein n=1 Tax=Symbiochloris irregularis TaxID=706552 RepID=A0AAW1NR14_9CHLO